MRLKMGSLTLYWKKCRLLAMRYAKAMPEYHQPGQIHPAPNIVLFLLISGSTKIPQHGNITVWIKQNRLFIRNKLLKIKNPYIFSAV